MPTTLVTLFLLLTTPCVMLATTPTPTPEDVEATSLLGAPLVRPPLDDETRTKRQAQLDEAKAALEAAPGNEDAIIWVGRRQAYLGHYHDAIETFTGGIAVHPGNHKLLRHRGHRYLTVREIQLAIADLEKAAAFIPRRADEVEPDGMPNAAGIPTSTSHTNITYHLGLGYYVSGHFEKAAQAYKVCLRYAKNPDMIVATRYWLYLSLRQLGEEEKARAVLEPITADLEIIENHAYHRLLLLYRGDLTLEALTESDEADGVQNATLAYGIARWHLDRGDPDAGKAALEALVAGPAWPAFGHLAAESDLARMRPPEPPSVDAPLPALDQATFRSKELLTGGMGPDGPTQMHWQLSFRGDRVSWYHTDVVESGTYQAWPDGRIRANMRGPIYEGRYSAAKDEVLWEGQWYGRRTR